MADETMRSPAAVPPGYESCLALIQADLRYIHTILARSRHGSKLISPETVISPSTAWQTDGLTDQSASTQHALIFLDAGTNKFDAMTSMSAIIRPGHLCLDHINKIADSVQ